MLFRDLPLNTSILRAVTEKGYTTPTLIQAQAIPLVLEKKDLITSAQTGTGKTAAFALPILQLLCKNQDGTKKDKKIRALIICPTRELVLQTDKNLKAYSAQTPIKTIAIFGGTAIEPQIDQLKNDVDIVVATPGRLLDLHKQDRIHLGQVEILVLDEADLMLDMGFIDDVKKIERLCPENKQTLLFSATMPFKVEQLAKAILKSPERIEVTPTSSVAENISQALYYVPKRNKIELCLHLLQHTIKGQVLIFRRTKFGVDKLEQTLIKNNFKATGLHGDKTQPERLAALNKFKQGGANILVATDVAARGLNINELDAVINFDIPNIPETYVHRIGRTGRAGNFGNSYSFCSADEKSYITAIQKLINVQIPVTDIHPFPLDPKAKPIIHTSKKTVGKYKKGRKGKGSKSNKKRWY